jgi:hypothetical protein
MSEAKTSDDRSATRSGLAWAWLAGLLAFCVSAPALFAREIFADDWTVYYVYWTEGAASVARLMRDAAHTGYTIPMEIFLALGQDMPELAARIIGLSCHLVNGVLLYRTLSRHPRTLPIAGLATALFLLSPFYVIRLTQNALYDFFLAFYLLSYVLMDPRMRVARWIAPLSLFVSLSLETLIGLEPLRLLFASREGQGWKAWLAKLVPFWLAIAAIVGLRLTILGKGGHYIGQYDAAHNIRVIIAALHDHLEAFPYGLYYAYAHGIGLLGRKAAVVLALAVMTLFALLGPSTFRSLWLLRSPQSRANAALIFVLGAAITFLGALPYALAGLHGEVTRGESRFLFPSQFGVLILLATSIQVIPTARMRAAVAGGAITLFALSMAHDTKWMIYDGLVTGDLQRQVRAALIADPEPKVVMLRIEDSSNLFFRGRCLGGSDMNVAHAILRDESKPRSFIYTENCGDFTNPDIVPRNRCPISYLDGNLCPVRREEWLYRAAPGIAPLDQIGFVELFSASISGSLHGDLLKLSNGQEFPLARAAYHPPCDRAGVRALLWLLAFPKRDCADD